MIDLTKFETNLLRLGDVWHRLNIIFEDYKELPYLEEYGAEVTFHVFAVDNGEPGDSDIFCIQIFGAPFSSYNACSQLLAGNIQVQSNL